MKSYPSINSSVGTNFREFTAHVFDKIDGSNLRFEWNSKRGYYKFGTRTRLLDKTDEMFGPAVELFLKSYLGETLASLFSKYKYKQAIAFCEFHGPNSFAGNHDPRDQHTLSLIDVYVKDKGLLGPQEYLDRFANDGLPRAEFFGVHKWTRGFVQDVYTGAFPCRFEGVVGKALDGRKLLMYKTKTQVWLDLVKEKLGEEQLASLR